MKENDIPTKKETSDTILFSGETSTYQIEVFPDANWKNGNITTNNSSMP